MPLNEISAFHPLVIIGMGISMAIIWYVTKMGISNGGKAIASGESSNAAQVVAIAADTKALDRVKDSGEKLSETIASFEKTYEKRSEDMNRRMEDLTDAIKTTNYELRELGKEIRNKGH
jgi:esterase/lipase